MITVELSGGPADGWKGPQIDFRVVLPIPPQFGASEGCYRVRRGMTGRPIARYAPSDPQPALLYDYQPPERLGA